MSRRNVAAAMESAMSEDEVAGVGDYEGAAAGWGALKAVADAVRGQMAIVKETRGEPGAALRFGVPDSEGNSFSPRGASSLARSRGCRPTPWSRSAPFSS